MKASQASQALLFLSLGAMWLAAACGYRFTPDGGALPEGVRAVYVPVFENDTAEPGIGAWFTEAMRLELSRANREGGEASEARLLGRITDVRDPTAIYTTDAAGQVRRTSARVEAVVELRLFKGDAILRQIKVRGGEDYLVSPGTGGSLSILEDDANRRLALRRLAERLMREGFERLQTF